MERCAPPERRETPLGMGRIVLGERDWLIDQARRKATDSFDIS